jgi:hypothetical protein
MLDAAARPIAPLRIVLCGAVEPRSADSIGGSARVAQHPLHSSHAYQQPIAVLTSTGEINMNTPTSTAALMSLALVAAGCAGVAPAPEAASVPDTLKPAANESLAMVVPAKGVQVYQCRARNDQPQAYEWAFVGPEAELFDLRGKPIGRHYAGPYWESSDGSKVLAKLKARADAPAGSAIPWLLLDARSVGPQGQFSTVTSIQRVNTVGGVAPRNGCSASMAGTVARVGYTADYYFFTAR